MQQSTLSWPASAQAIQTSAETVTAQITTELSSAVALLDAIKADAAYSRHPLSSQAEALLTLRAELDALLCDGQVITASPYVFQVGNKQSSGQYLNPQTAIATLANKLLDNVDKNRPTGNLNCIAIMVSESQLTTFASTLTSLTAAFALPDWCQVARQATALSTNAVDKLHQPAAIALPRFKPLAKLNANPLRELLKHQGAQLATLESLANDKNNVIEKLSALADKRADKLSEISAAISALQSISGTVYSLQLSGTAQSIATQLKQASVPGNNQHTVASLLISSQPFTFFGELLC